MRQLLDDLSLCVVDEFDAQAAEDIDEEGEPIGRFSKSSEKLINTLKTKDIRFLCMSATKREASESWLSYFSLKEVEIQKMRLVRHRWWT